MKESYDKEYQQLINPAQIMTKNKSTKYNSSKTITYPSIIMVVLIVDSLSYDLNGFMRKKSITVNLQNQSH